MFTRYWRDFQFLEVTRRGRYAVQLTSRLTSKSHLNATFLRSAPFAFGMVLKP